MSFKFVKTFNSSYCSLIELNGEYYAYENGKTNGEYYKGWHCDEFGNQLESDKRDYKIKPIYAGEFDNYKIVDVEIEYL